MAIETRNGRPYYYTSHRVGARVTKEYHGSGGTVFLMARVDQGNRALRRIDRDTEQERVAKRQRVTAKLRKWLARINATVADAMAANGWHQHKGEWRLKRGNAMGTLATTGETVATWVPSELSALAWPRLSDEAKAKAAKADHSVLPGVDRYLGTPAATALFGDVGRLVLQKYVAMLAGEDVLWSQAMLRFASDLRTRLAGSNPTALDHLVAERVVLAWIFLNFCDWQYAAKLDKATPDQGQFFLKRTEVSHRNLMAACRTLAKVKKAKLPDVLALVTVTPPNAV